MAAAATDNFMEVGDPGSATNLAGSGYTIGATSITVTTTTNWPTNTGVIFGIDTIETDAEGNEVRVDGSYCIFQGVVTSATTIGSISKLFGDDQDYAAGASTRVYITVSTEHTNRMIQALLEEHNQNGTHSDITATSVTATTGTFTSLTINGSSGADGWSPLGQSLTSVTALGNGSYTAVVSGVDTTGTTSVGQRMKIVKTVTAPTQCTSLNGSTQYYSRASASLGTTMTFTDDFTVSAWVKLSSYTAGKVASRFNGTSGWQFGVESTGQLSIFGYSGSGANYTGITSYQSIPLNKWVHIAAQLDMSSSTMTGGTANYFMINGVDVLGVRSQGGTNPSSLIQAGNLEIGSANGGATPFPGKISQVALYSAKVTQATILASMNQTLTGSETSLISAYSFNNSINDLNTTSANNLTANGSAVATNADTPFANSVTGTSITAGTTNYAIITGQTFSTNTTYTLQLPEGETLPTTGGLGTAYYSTQKTPYGFPTDREKWVVDSIYLSVITTAASAGTAYNPGSASLTIPVGAWKLNFEGNMYFGKSAASSGQVVSLLSTAAASSTPLNYKMSSTGYLVATGATVVESISRHGCSPEGYTATTATTVYANLYAELSLTTLGWFANTAVKGKALAITAELAYL